MNDSTMVYFSGIERGFTVNGVLAEFSLFGMDFSIRWYGVLIAFGFMLAVLFGGRMAYKWKMNLDKMLDVLIYGTIGGILGARLYYVIFNFSQYQDDFWGIFKIWNGGLAIYGGIIGGVLGAMIVCKIRKLNFLNLLDIASMSFLIGQGIGRWGNFTNQEAFGTNTSLPWGMWSEHISKVITSEQAKYAAKGFEVDPSLPVHPTFLYESLWCIIGFFVLYLICKKFRKFSGQIALCYGIWYGTGRTIFEGLRTDSLYIGSTTLRASQVLSMALVLVCAALLVFMLIKRHKNPKPIEGVDFFAEEPEKKEKTKKSRSEKNKPEFNLIPVSALKKDEGEPLETAEAESSEATETAEETELHEETDNPNEGEAIENETPEEKADETDD